jgi:hypothetical protein
MGAFTLTDSSHRSASQLYSQIHELKEDLYRSHIEILDLKQENKELKQKLNDK